jgi:hypothetical protein
MANRFADEGDVCTDPRFGGVELFGHAPGSLFLIRGSVSNFGDSIKTFPL